MRGLLLDQEAPLHPLTLFARFMEQIHQSVELLVDFLISPETAVTLLSYVLSLCRFLKQLSEDSASSPPAELVQFVVDTLSRLHDLVRCLPRDQLPYNPTALLRQLASVQRLLWFDSLSYASIMSTSSSLCAPPAPAAEATLAAPPTATPAASSCSRVPSRMLSEESNSPSAT
jgi:hypothetical protein